MPREVMYAEAIGEAIAEEMQRDPTVIYYGQNMAMTEKDPFCESSAGTEFGSPLFRKRHRSAWPLAQRRPAFVPWWSFG